LFLYINIIQALVTPLLWIFIAPQFPSPAGWTPLLISCTTCVAAYLFLYTALHCGDVSSVMPLMGSKVIFPPLCNHPLEISSLNLDSEVGIWMQGAAPSALLLMLTIFPGLTAGATLCRRFAPGDVICSVWGEIRTHGSSDVEPRKGDRK